jgi:chromate reductase, NAD(P)H dehydrogenase (quinone)
LPRLLAISGTHRAASWNTVLFEAMAALAPAGVSVTVHRDTGSLPHYAPELEEFSPAPVLRLRAAVAEHAAVVLASPDLPGGIPGVLKNALDWLATSGELAGKPVALISTSPRTTYALASLAETLATLQAILIPAACVTVPLAHLVLDKAKLLDDAGVARALRQCTTTLLGSL